MIIRQLKQHRLVLIATMALVVGSCGGDGLTTPTEGSIRVETSTSGADLDSDGYSVNVDEQNALVIGVSDQVVFNDVGLGTHQVTLSGLAANCTTAEGLNPQAIDVVGGDTVTVAFAVTCAPLDGGGGGGGTLSVGQAAGPRSHADHATFVPQSTEWE
jgi:hypothetical protein